MAWKKETEVIPGPVPPEDLLKRESFWLSGYNEPDRWIKDMADCRCMLTGEYAVDEDRTLYRFEFNEDFRGEYPHTAHFHNVLVSRSIGERKIATVIVPDVCKTCGK